MKSIITYLLLFSAPFWGLWTLQAQDTRQDSLLSVFHNSQLDTLTRLEAAYELCAIDLDVGPPPKEAEDWAMEALTLAQEARMESFYSRFALFMSIMKMEASEIKKAAEFSKLAADYSSKAKGQLEFVLSIIYYQLDKRMLNRSLNLDSLLQIAWAQLEEVELDEKAMRTAEATTGVVYYRNQKFPEAIFWFNQMLTKVDTTKPLGYVTLSSLSFLGEIYLELAQYEKALAYLQQALRYSRRASSSNNLNHVHSALSDAYVRMGAFEQALFHIDSALLISPDCNCKGIEEMSLALKGHILNQMGKPQEALALLLPLQDYNFVLLDGKVKNYLAYTYLKLGEYRKAIAQADRALNSRMTMPDNIRDAHEVKYKSWAALGNYPKAFESLEVFHKMADSVKNMQSNQRVVQVEMENRFAREKLESELAYQAELTRQKTSRNWIMFLGVVALLLALGLLYRLRLIRKIEAALKKKNEIIEAEKQKAQASERAKHQFLANMSHEIRTPMNAIKGMTDIMLRRDPKPEHLEYLDGIKQSSDSLLIIIDDILDISKIEAGKIELEQEPFSVNELVENVHTIMQFKAEEKGLELRKNIPAEEIRVAGDATRLRQVLINLLGNAIKFTHKGVVTTTLTASQLAEEQVELHFIVSDTGIGIDEDRLDKIFKSFEQAYSDTSRKFGGTGLGLSISRKLVELHDGRMWVESEKGKGSQFHFVIPYQVAAPLSSAGSTSSSERGVGEQLAGISILLVEDNHFNAIVAQEELEDAIRDVTIELAENGAIAVEKLKSGDFDLVLMDVQMPIMNGYEATQKIRALPNGKAETPIIAMTANVLKEEVELCYQAGMNDFIGKPFDTDDLLSKIQVLITKPSAEQT
jgi:signal transduction histidine kinase/ActR/RegA family two-component response regulator